MACCDARPSSGLYGSSFTRFSVLFFFLFFLPDFGYGKRQFRQILLKFNMLFPRADPLVLDIRKTIHLHGLRNTLVQKYTMTITLKMQTFTETGHGDINITWNRRNWILQRTSFLQRGEGTNTGRLKGDGLLLWDCMTLYKEWAREERQGVGMPSESVSDGFDCTFSEIWKRRSLRVMWELPAGGRLLRSAWIHFFP